MAVTTTSPQADIPSTIHLAGHVLMILGLILRSTPVDPRFAYITVQLGLAIQVVSACLLTRNIRFLRFQVPHIFLAFYLIYLALAGYVATNFNSYILSDCVGFGLFANVLVGANTQLCERIFRLYARLLPIVAICALYVASTVRPATFGARLVLSDGGDVDFLDFSTMRELCIPAVFLLLHTHLRPLPRIAAYLMIVAQLSFGVFTATRGDVLVPIITIVGIATQRIGAQRHRWQFLLILLVVTVAATYSYGATRVSESVANFENRLEGPDIDAGRELEASVFINMTSGSLFVLGRGLGGAYHGAIRNSSPYGMSIVHFAPLHLILKGGIVLLALVTLIVGFAIISSIIRHKKITGNAWFLVGFILSSLGHTQFLAYAYMSLFAIALGVALRKSEPEKDEKDDALNQPKGSTTMLNPMPN